MLRMLRPCSFTLLLALLAAGSLPAQTPDPALSTVPDVILDPCGAIRYWVAVESTEGPVEGSVVRLDFTAVQDTICWCPSQVYPVVESVTDSNGIADFHIAGGQCVESGVMVYADDVFLAEVGAVSPDVREYFSDPRTCSTGLIDCQYFGWAFQDWFDYGTYDFCADLDRDGTICVSDLYLFNSFCKWNSGCDDPQHCPFDPFLVDLPGDNDNAGIALHIGPQGDCMSIPQIHPDSLVVWVRPESYPAEYGIWILACGLGDSTGLAGVEYGIEYDGEPESGIDVYWHRSCMFAGWFDTESGGGTLIEGYPEYIGDSTLAVIGVLYVTVYSPDQLRIIPHPTSGSITITDIAGVDTDLTQLTPSRAGMVGFDRAGYDACTRAPTSVGDVPPDPSPAALRWVSPNPFRNTAAVAYTVPREGHVLLAVHDVQGRRVATLADGNLPAGDHQAVWDGRGNHGEKVASGIYFVRLIFENAVRGSRLVLLR